MRRPTMADIARRAGVSKGAVSYALNGQPGVSRATRERIMAIAAELGFNPNSAARALSGATANAVGLALCRPARVLGVEPFFMELISGVEAELAAHSYALTLQVVADPDAEIAVYRRWWGERRVDGVLVCDLRVDDRRVPALEELRLPAVVIGGPGHAGRLPSVWSDDAAALVETVEYLAALGHRRVARVGGLAGLLHTELRTSAFAEVCARLGLDECTTVSSDYTGEEGARATRRLLSSARPPTAIVYDNDVMAIAGLAVAQEMGVAVPAELSIVAWDDSPLCRLTHPPLTALSRDIPGYGARAARQLLAAVAGRQVDSVQDSTARITPRGSTAPPNPDEPTRPGDGRCRPTVVTIGQMTVLRYAAFSADKSGGNPAGVILDATGMADADMLAMAADIGYSESAFVVPRPDGALDVRYFSPLAEVPFCGHATIATAVAHAQRHGVGTLRFHTMAGPVDVSTRIAHDGAVTATLVSVAPRSAPISAADLAELLAALRWSASELDARLPPRAAYAGAWHPVIAAASRARLAALDYDLDALAALMRRREWTTVDLVWRESETVYHARNPFPPGGVVEDPATGAAAAAFGGYLRDLGLVSPPATLTIHQGLDMGRPGTITVRVPAEPDSGIEVTGTAVEL